MPEQPNHCTTCGKLIPDSNAAYYCSKECWEVYHPSKNRKAHNEKKIVLNTTEKP